MNPGLYVGAPKGYFFLQQQSSLLKRTQVAQPRAGGVSSNMESPNNFLEAERFS